MSADQLSRVMKAYEDRISRLKEIYEGRTDYKLREKDQKIADLEKQLREKDEKIERQNRCIDARGRFVSRVHQKNKVLKEEINRLKGN